MNLYDCIFELDEQCKSYQKFLIDSASQIVQMNIYFSEVVADQLANLIENFNEKYQFNFN